MLQLRLREGGGAVYGSPQGPEPTTAILSDMDQPLGQTIGNAIEVNEACQVLGGRRGEVRDLTIELCAELLLQAGAARTLDQARNRLARNIDSGHAMERFERMVSAQGGRLEFPLKLAPGHHEGVAIGQAVVALGGGRRRKNDAVDHRVGVKTHGRIGEEVHTGDPILTLHCHPSRLRDYVNVLGEAVDITDSPVQPRPLILQRLGH